MTPSASPARAGERPREPGRQRTDFGAFDQLPDGVVITDASGRIEYVNLAFCALLGRELEDVLAQPLEAIVAEQDMLHLLGFGALFGAEGGQDVSLLFSRGDDQQQRLVVNFRRRESRVFLTLRDSGVIERELSDAARWAAEEHERADVLGVVKDCLVADNAELRMAQSALEQALQKLQEEVATRERLEAELRLAQKLESIGQLAAGIAHEINTPMQYIGDNVNFIAESFAQFTEYRDALRKLLLGRGYDQEHLSALESELGIGFVMEQVPQALSSSQDGIKHVSGIVKAMKSFARTDQGEKVASDLNQSIRDTLMVAQNEYKNVAAVETELAELPAVICFPSKLNQVVLNLIVNAAHAIADQKRAELGKIRIRSRHAGESVEISISDDGGGIPEAIRHKVFDQFFTTKAIGRGTGQGLSIARRIVVEVHGGRISFESEVGQGTTFRIALPVDGSSKLAD
ncbi:MAG TPA: ATP-binding protein [Polyangiaceae bacterium]